MSKVTYKNSGVDIDMANKFVDAIKPMIKKTQRPEVMGGIGGFGALFKLNAKDYKKPLLVSSTDGVGTKLKCAKDAGIFDVLGVDLVAMNVNDIITCGAEPLFFLDYLAVSKVKLDYMKEIVSGISQGCVEAGCALIGGETAEMPGLYKKDDFDLAGFTVGVVEEDELIDGSTIQEDDAIIGCASNGLHANGFSFVRKAFKPSYIQEHAKDILKPTRIYVKPFLELKKKINVKGAVHVTGGGFYDNIPRVLPKGFCALIDSGSWKIPNVFTWLQEKGKTPYQEMYRTFNMGIGFMIIVSQDDALKALNCLTDSGVESWVIGKVDKGEGVRIQ